MHSIRRVCPEHPLCARRYVGTKAETEESSCHRRGGGRAGVGRGRDTEESRPARTPPPPARGLRGLPGVVTPPSP